MDQVVQKGRRVFEHCRQPRHQLDAVLLAQSFCDQALSVWALQQELRCFLGSVPGRTQARSLSSNAVSTSARASNAQVSKWSQRCFAPLRAHQNIMLGRSVNCAVGGAQTRQSCLAHMHEQRADPLLACCCRRATNAGRAQRALWLVAVGCSVSVWVKFRERGIGKKPWNCKCVESGKSEKTVLMSIYRHSETGVLLLSDSSSRNLTLQRGPIRAMHGWTDVILCSELQIRERM